MAKKISKEMVVAEARSWLGTPFHHQGRLKGIGGDCIGLVIGVANALNISDYNITNYSRLPNGDLLKGLLELHLDKVAIADRQIGDIGLFKFEREPQHVGVFSDIGIIHNYQQVKQCVEHGFDSVWQQRLLAVFRFKGVN